MKSSVICLQSSARNCDAAYSFRNHRVHSYDPVLIYNEINSPAAFDLSDTWIPARPGFADERRLTSDDLPC